MPTGGLIPFAGASAPSGWLLCNGASLNATASPEYAALFSVIGTTYGGSSIAAFNVPDLRGRSPMGAGTGTGGGTSGAAGSVPAGGVGLTNRVLGAWVGDERSQNHNHTGTTSGHSADHSHSGTTSNPSANHSHGMGRTFDTSAYGWNIFGGGAGWTLPANSNTGGVSEWHTHTLTTGGVSANHTHTFTTSAYSAGTSENMMPALVTNFIIKT